jgi:hypothetical protein
MNYKFRWLRYSLVQEGQSLRRSEPDLVVEEEGVDPVGSDLVLADNAEQQHLPCLGQRRRAAVGVDDRPRLMDASGEHAFEGGVLQQDRPIRIDLRNSSARTVI